MTYERDLARVELVLAHALRVLPNGPEAAVRVLADAFARERDETAATVRGVIEALRAEHEHFGECSACDRTCSVGDDKWFAASDALHALAKLDATTNGGGRP